MVSTHSLTSELSATITSSTILVSVTTSRLSCGQEARCVRQISWGHGLGLGKLCPSPL